MKIVNVMWSGGSPFMSVHNVHSQVLAHGPADARVCNWLLLGEGLCRGVGEVRHWQLSPRVLKGRWRHRLALFLLRRRLLGALKADAPDVLLLDGLGVARLLLPLLHRLPGVQVAVLFHGTTRLTGKDVRLFGQFPAERLRVAAVSATLAQALAHDLGRPVQTLRVALDPQAFGRQLLGREQARQALGLSAGEGGPVLGAVGRLVESKGFGMLIEAFAQARTPGMQLVILGDGELRGALQAQAKVLGVEDSVRFCGHREELAQLYPALDWLLVPSRSEGLGLVLQEAVLSRVPVICSDLPVFCEQLGEAGCYVPVGDAARWAEAIARCARGDAASIAAQQWRALAPEQGWAAFTASARRLLGG
ncbi:glycosyltransferase [Pseudomonas sp. UFMG81]|uniref:glycosyltransferase n=1 Tax=Pseudomonas sp. UFMG81 TaxID=2745936 RepID=UPI00189053B5|nr:glycosyltransferase family 4 protein [Pseudomonas sp. UFMG81]